MALARTPGKIRDANLRYHDVAADDYDAKWGIDFGPIGRSQVLAKLERALGPRPGPFRRALEIGAGTGYFSLNLLQDGIVEQATCCDISPGMLRRLRTNAAELGVEVETVAAGAERLPFEDGSFDLVFGHAVLHHIPDLPRAFREFHRVLAPRGRLAFAGEPSRYGDRIAGVPKLAGTMLAPVWRVVVGASPAEERETCDEETHRLERVVDVHAFAPGDLRIAARDSGFEDVTVRGEELTANLFGWLNRTLEASAEPDSVPLGWQLYAYHGYVVLQRLDRHVLESRLPAAAFYNLILSATRPIGRVRRSKRSAASRNGAASTRSAAR